MTVVTVTFPDERTKSSHMHAKFTTERDAKMWFYWMVQRFGPLQIEYDDGGMWACSSCGLRSGRVPRPKVSVGRTGFTDLE